MLNLKGFWTRLAVGALQIGFGLAIWSGWAKRALGAENIVLNYGVLELSVSVDSLSKYATEGKLEGALANYAYLLTPEQLQQLKTGLTIDADLDPIAMAQFLHSYQGEKMLERVSSMVQTEDRRAGFRSIRSALILAAADGDRGGLTLLKFIENFPTNAIRIDFQKGLELFRDLNRFTQINDKAIAAVERTAQQRARTTAANPITNLDLSTPGDNRYYKQILNIEYGNRDRPTLKGTASQRTLPVNLYLPVNKTKQLLPLIVISHGLGGNLTSFTYLAEHLASYGFAVAVLEHYGSDASQIKSFTNGSIDNLISPEELIDRPLDVRFLLDKLALDYGKQIDTNNVGVIGHSFGAYTALALAGAEFNWKTLAKDCGNIEKWNMSLSVQCLALQLPEEARHINLKEERIGSAIAISPFVSSVFSRQSLAEIDIPLMMVSGSADFVTPASSEQIVPFGWLTTTRKYLVLISEATHFSFTKESVETVSVPSQILGSSSSSEIARTYIKQLAPIFFDAYLKERSHPSREGYVNYLDAEYARAISKKEMPLSLVKTIDSESLKPNSQVNCATLAIDPARCTPSLQLTMASILKQAIEALASNTRLILNDWLF